MSIVTIVGRPNVGKSTLYNRLVGRREAIIDNQSGVTRDNHYGVAEWGGKTFTIVDTGGLVEGSEDVFEGAIKNQVFQALEQADAILFLVDLQSGLTPLDQEVANLLRPLEKQTLLVVNKADTPDKLNMSGEFYALGFDTVHTVSAESGTGTGDLLDALVQHLPENEEEKEDKPKIAIVGRPNVGKSSMTNLLLGYERSIVTDRAGTTRDPVNAEFNAFGHEFLLIDTAGLRKKGKVRDDLEFYSVLRSIQAIEQSDVCIVMLDATQGLEAQDLNIIHLALQRKKGALILVNKWDLVEKDSKTAKAFEDSMKQRFGNHSYIPILFISVKDKQRVHKALDVAISVFNERNKRISTSKLNDTLLPLMERTPPGTDRGRHIKIKYVTQLPTKTPAFAFFCNLPKGIKASYKGFIENQIRKYFGFQGVPISLVFKKK